jgi:hypothetical protein
MKSVINILYVVAIGALAGLGIRAAEWAIPAPEMRVVVCAADEMYKVKECRSAADLLREAKK